MIQEFDIWLERLSALHKSQMRQAASSEGLQLVHVEILKYLSISNRYSNTAQAMSEYLGQTKGSISQSIKFLENNRYIKRKACKEDGRITRLFLTDKAKRCLNRISDFLMPRSEETNDASQVIKALLANWQQKNNQQGFGLCQTCRFNRALDGGQFQCGLTKAPLSSDEVKLICREHEFAHEL